MSDKTPASPASTPMPPAQSPGAQPPSGPSPGPAQQPPAGQPPADSPPASPPAGTPPAEAPPADARATPPTGAAPSPAAGVPAGGYALQIPLGCPLTPDDVARVTAHATAEGWSQDRAQEALTLVALHAQATSAAMAGSLVAHPEIGGDKLPAAQARANRALDRYLPATTPEGQELRAGLIRSGYGNYAPLVLLLSRIGAALGEDRPPVPDATLAGASRDPVTVLYGG